MTSRDASRWNASRFEPAGGYESWFLRANAPSSGDAFWVRYTLFSDGVRSCGELWAVAFVGDRVLAAKTLHPFDPAEVSRADLRVRLGDATLCDGVARGEVHGAHRLAWDLRWSGGGSPLLLLPERLYRGRFPKAKALVPRPLVRFEGTFVVDGEALDVGGWVGSQNHNWGKRHTDEYAWGQVAGFDDAPGVFLELSTARVKVGPLKTPWLTPIVLREGSRELRLSGVLRAARNEGRYDERALRWNFAGGDETVRLEGSFEAPRDAFVALPYANPPGGTKTCLNTKIARCVLRVHEEGRSRELVAQRRAAFEILTDRGDHGIPLEVLPDPRGA